METSSRTPEWHKQRRKCVFHPASSQNGLSIPGSTGGCLKGKIQRRKETEAPCCYTSTLKKQR